MSTSESLIARDLRHVWHPCMQMKAFETCPPLVVERAKGSYLYTDQGALIDAISSWWCKSLGHGHPAVISAITDQLQRFEHVIAGNTTHPLLVELAEKLSEITRRQHVFFASDGACAVEIAMKLTIHAMQIRGHAHKNKFIALKNGYHGETLGAMSVGDLGIYNDPYKTFGVDCHLIDLIPYVANTDDPLWHNAEAHWLLVQERLESIKDSVCAIILEPIVQGAAGMRCYSADFLARLAQWAKAQGIYFIADEIMTGIGRTGEWLACDHANITPDLICLSKGLTSGSLPFSCVMLDDALFDLFYAEPGSNKSFLHSHTFSANPLAVSAALATLRTIEQENLIQHAQNLGIMMRESMQQLADLSGKLTNVRGVGALVAADLDSRINPDIGNVIYQQGLRYGALLRPIGDTLYWLPPLNTDNETIAKLTEITLNSIKAAYK